MKANRSRNWRLAVGLGLCGMAAVASMFLGVCRTQSCNTAEDPLIVAARSVEPMNWQGQFRMTVGL